MSSGADVDELRARLDALAAERAELWEQLHERRATEREVEDLRRQVAYMEGTLSWRITAPLRLGKRLAHKIKVGLDPDYFS